MSDSGDPRYFDVGYGLAYSTSGPGTFVVATTAADFYGYSIVCTSAGAVIRIYDSTGSAAGTLLGQGVFGATVSTESSRFSQVKARKGIVLFSTLSTGASVVIYYGPKG